MDKILALIKRLLIKQKYKGLKIGLRSYLHGPCEISNNITIGNNSFITNCKLKKYNRIDDNCIITNVRLDSFSYISKGCKLKNVNIGKFCSIGPEVYTGFGNHPTNLLSTSPVFYSNQKQCGISFSKEATFNENPYTTIGNDVWIGARAIIKDGITIGNGVIIGAGAVVVKDIEPYAIVGGVPARLIRYRFDKKQIEKLQNTEWWNWDIKKLKENIDMFASSPSKFFN